MTQLTTSPVDLSGAHPLSAPAEMPIRRNAVAEALIAHRGFGDPLEGEPETKADPRSAVDTAALIQESGKLSMPSWEAGIGRQPLLRTSMMVAIFFVGALIGLITTWWLIPGMSRQTPAQAHSRTGDERAAIPPRLAQGTSAQELPFDGSLSHAEKKPKGTNRLSENGLSALTLSGKSDADTAVASYPEASVPRQAMPLPGEQNRDSVPVAKPSAEAPANSRNPHRLQRSPGADAVDMPKRNDGHSSRSKEDSRSRLARDEESLKHRQPQKRATEAGNTAKRASPAVSSTQLALGKCERKSNFILKEHCLWEVCNGRWGKNGCPSYERPTNIY